MMAIPFSRSIRSMKQDRFQPGIIAILLIGSVLVLWIVWFFGGQLSVYGTTEKIQIREDGMLLAYLPAEVIAQITPGQAAEFILPSQEGKTAGHIQAEVMNVPASSNEPVEIYLFSSTLPTGEQKGQLKILLEKISPAQWIWRSFHK